MASRSNKKSSKPHSTLSPLVETAVKALGQMKGTCSHDKSEKTVKECDICIAEATVFVCQNFIMHQLAYEIEQSNFMQVEISMQPDEAVDWYRASLAKLLRGENPDGNIDISKIVPTQVFKDESEEK